MPERKHSADTVGGSTGDGTGQRTGITLKRCVLLAVVGALLLAPAVGTGGLAGSDPGATQSAVPSEEPDRMQDAAEGQANGTDDVDYAEYSGELGALANVSLAGSENDEGDAAVEALPDEVREAAEAGARDGVRLAEERGVDVTADREQAAVDGALRAAAEVEGAPPEAIRAAAKGATHGALLQSRGEERDRAATLNATQVRASVYGSAAGALSQHRTATATQLQSASYGAAHGTTARHRNATVLQIQHAAVAASAGAAHGAARTEATDVTRIQEAAQGASYGALTQAGTVALVQIQAAAFGAAGGAVEVTADRAMDPKKVQQAAMGAARGALVGVQRASVEAIQAAARGACAGALVQEQRVSVTQIQQASAGAAQGAISQHQVASVRQIQAAATGGAKGVLRGSQRVDVVQIQLAALGAAKGGAGAAAQYQVTTVEQIQAAAAGAGWGSVVQIQQVNVRQVQVIAEGAAEGALSQHQEASVVQIQSAARGASEGALSLTQVQIVNIQQIQVISERAAAETVETAVEVDVTVEQTIYRYAKGAGEQRDSDPELRSLFFDVDDETLFFANPNEVAVTVTVTSEDGDVETITLSPGESLTRSFDPGTYTLTAESEAGRTVEIAGRQEVTVSLGPDAGSLTATVENGTLTVENPNEDSAIVTVREDGDNVLTFAVPSTSDRTRQLDPGEYTVTARLDGASVRINGEDEFAFTVVPREVYLDVSVDDQVVTVRNPTATAVTVTAIDDGTGAEREITVPGETTRNRTLEPGNYTLVGATEDPEVFLNGRPELSINIAEPAARFGVDVVDVTDPVEAGESLTVTAEISNDGDEAADEEITLDVGDREGVNSTIVELDSGANETITLSYRTTEDDVGARNVTVRSSTDAATATVDVLEADGEEDPRTIDSCTVISEAGVYEVADDVEATAADFEDDGGACIRIDASDVVIAGDDNAVAGDGEGIGVLVAGTDGEAAANVTIRNLRVEGWETGIQVGYRGEEGEARIANVSVAENEGSGISVTDAGNASVESVEADRNGEAGLRLSEGEGHSLANVTATDNDGDGVRISGSRNVTAEGITATGNGDAGLDVDGVSASEFTDVTATDNEASGLDIGADVSRNEFSGVYAADNGGPGLSITGNSSTNVVRNATIEDNDGAGILHGENRRNEFRNVTVSGNGNGQVEAERRDDATWFSASELRIGEAAEFAFEEESVSIETVGQDDLPELPEDADAIGDGVGIEGIDDGVELALAYDADATEGDGRIELWRYDGEEWSSAGTVDPDEADGVVDSTLTANGTYAPVSVTDDGEEGDDAQAIDSCTVISEPGTYEVVDDIDRQGDPVPADHDDACLRITASDVVLEGDDNVLVGHSAADDPPATVGILVGGTDDAAAENVTIRNLRVEGWAPGIQIGLPGEGEARIADVVVAENDGHGVSVTRAGDASVETVRADRNGGAGIRVSEGAIGSMANVTANANGGDGIDVSEGRVGSMVNVTANGNGEHGITLTETGEVTAERITADGNGGHGIYLSADVYSSEFTGVRASDNEGPGIGLHADSSGNVVRDSTVENNGGPGIAHGQNDRNEFRNVTVRDNADGQVDAYDDNGPYSAAELGIGEAAVLAFDDQPLSLDAVDGDDLPELPDDAEAIGDGVELDRVDDDVDLTLEYDGDVSDEDGRIELWRYDGGEWTAVETVDSDGADGVVNSTLTADGVYAPVLVAEAEQAVDLAVDVEDRDVTIENPSDTAVTVTATDDATSEEQPIEVPADGAATEEFDPGSYTLRGDAEDGRPVTLDGDSELAVTVDAPDPAEFVIQSVEPNEPVEAGEPLAVTVEIENVGGETATREISLDVGDREAVDAEELELAPDEPGSVELTYQTDVDDVGELDLTVRTADSTESVTVTVQETEGSENGEGTEGSEDTADGLIETSTVD